MVERRRVSKSKLNEDEAPSRKPQDRELELYRSQLKIDEDDLNQALMDQSELYHHVSDELVTEIAERDSLKLLIEQTEARLDKEIRKEAVDNEEKVTESQVKQRIADHKDVRELNSDMVDQQEKVNRWSALKDAYSMRSQMLRKMVDILLSERYQAREGSVERGARKDIAENNYDAASRERRRRREEKTESDD